MAIDTDRLGAGAAAIFADIEDQLRRRFSSVWVSTGAFVTQNLPFSAYMSIGHDAAKPDEDIAVSIDVTPDHGNLDVTIAWGDGRLIADEEFPIAGASSVDEEIDTVMAQAHQFLREHLDSLCDYLAALS